MLQFMHFKAACGKCCKLEEVWNNTRINIDLLKIARHWDASMVLGNENTYLDLKTRLYILRRLKQGQSRIVWSSIDKRRIAVGRGYGLWTCFELALNFEADLDETKFNVSWRPFLSASDCSAFWGHQFLSPGPKLKLITHYYGDNAVKPMRC